MPPPKKTPETTGLMPWAEVARRVGLSPKQTRKIALRALRKMREALEAQGVTLDYLRGVAHDREREAALSKEQLTALLGSAHG